MGYCDGLISASIADATCAQMAVKGFERVGYIINRADIDFGNVTFSSSKKNVITALPLKTGKKAYEIVQKGNTPFTGTNGAMESGTYGNTITNTVTFAILNNDQSLADSVQDSLLNGEFVVILEYKDKGASNNSAFRVFGIHNGLVMTEFAHDAYGDAYAGSVNTLTESGAPMTAVFLGESYESAKTLIASLLQAAA